MGIIIRQSAKTVAVTYTGIALGFLNTLVLYPLVLSQEQVGLTRILINAALLFSTFAALGSATVPTVFFPYFRDHTKQHNGFLFFILSIGSIGFVLFLTMFLAFKPLVLSTYSSSAPLLVEYFYYIIPLTFFLLFYSILENYTIVHQMPVIPTFLREVFIRGMIALGMVLVLVHFISFGIFIPWMIGAYGFSLLIIIYYLKHHHILFLKPDRSVLHGEKFKPMLVFGGFVVLGNISGSIMANIDGLMLSAYSGLKSTGIYTISFFIAQIVEIPQRSLSQVLIPLISQASKDNDIGMLKKLYKKSSINQLIVGGIIFLCIWVNIDTIFKFIPNGGAYSAGKWVVFFIGLGKLFDMATGINSEIIGASKYFRYNLLFYVLLSLCGIGFSIYFIPKYGLTGAAIAQAFAVFMYNSARYLFILKLYKMQPFSKSTLWILILGILVIVLNSIILSFGHPLIDLIVRTIVVAAVFLGGSIAVQASEEINSIVSKIFTRAKHLMGFE